MPDTSARAAMIGRAAELRTLSDAFDASRAGEPRVVVVRGEAGIGKTRLLQEFRAGIADPRDGGPPVVLAVGQCVDIGEIGAPYTPIRRLLREVYRAVGDDAFREAAQTPTVLATLGSLLPELADGGTETAARGADYVAEALERVIEELSADFHLVLILEDLHWADAATIALLRTLSVTLRGSSVTVVMTYRSDDVGRGHPLRPLLADLERNRAVTVVEVTRLAPEQTAELVTRIGTGLTAEDLAAVIGRSGGVPFFVEELVDLDGEELPATLRDLVLARYERTADETKAVVGVLAAGGVQVPNDVLDEVSPAPPDALNRALREALDANVVVAVDDGYMFRHALIQESVHADLLPSERAALHARYGEALERRLAAQPELAASVAEHWMQARDLTRAFEATVAARRHALATFAPAAAAPLGERLLELWPQVAAPDVRAGRKHSELLLEVALEWRDLGDAVRALRLARAGFTGDLHDPIETAQLHWVVSASLGNTGRLVEGLREARIGIGLVEGLEDSRALAVQARLLGLMATQSQDDLAAHEDREDLAGRAVSLAERSGDLSALSATLTNAAWVASDLGDFDAGLGHVRRIIDLADVDDADRLKAILFEVDVLVRSGAFEEALDACEAAAVLARSSGLERGIGAMIAANKGEALLCLGRTAEALGVLERSGSLLTAMPQFRSFTVRLRVIALQWADRVPEAVTLREDSAALVAEVTQSDPEEQIGFAECDTELALSRRGSSTDADRTLLVQAVAGASILGGGGFVHEPGMSRRMLPGAARAAADAQLTGVDTGGLWSYIDALVAALVEDDPATAYCALVAAERARADGPAPAAWREAVEVLERGFLPVRYTHYARWRLAEALVATGDRDDAAETIARVIAEAPSQGTELMARFARELAERAGIPLDGSPAPHTTAGSGVSSLTPRELQVLELVAEGLTNGQIGQRLFISPKTASVHVSAILTKIGAANRAEAAAMFSTSAPELRSGAEVG